ncbi:class I SAM-dependent methyltransferase [Rhodococcus tibetensis]|uniref:Methyltransferase domain-containing protein n=1 Tax=Rhodococcus tibetensis TaxID=2965064 RepID=A0ABT1QEN6_9NOCA|nr:methyltransferase domain-containing protein [Rhodococcus sp. FXJ9.536]MCQ4120723.1 methyltransferase domain-containing protein [Rhodococcus sp. FXJ9.536]
MANSHEKRIRTAFTRQAPTFEEERLNTAFTSSVPWLLDHLAPEADDVILDVAGGTGIVSRSLAPRVARVVSIDSTPAMIDEGIRCAAVEGLANLDFVRGTVEALPFASAAFTLVFARFALHHLTDPRRVVVEMARVCRPGGRVAVMDLAASTDPGIAKQQNQMERLRDPSHVRMLTRGVVPQWLHQHGLVVDRVTEQEIDRPVHPWLEQAGTEKSAAARIHDAFVAELDGGAETGMCPHRGTDGASLWFRQLWEITVAHKG